MNHLTCNTKVLVLVMIWSHM